MPEEKPYTIANLISSLTALIIEGAVLVAGLTWLSQHDPGMGAGVAHLFTVFIALLSIGFGALQIHHYQTDRYRPESEE